MRISDWSSDVCSSDLSSMTPLFPTLFAIAARRFRIAASTLFALSLYLPAAQAGVSYQMDQPQAAAGQTIRISSILFNDTDSAMHYVAPERIVLQWHGERGAILSSIAYREAGNSQVDIPVNNFVRFRSEENTSE